MPKLNFPSNPSIGQEYVAGSVTYIFNGISWDSQLIGEVAPNEAFGMVWKGSWNTTTEYNSRDVVSYNQVLYITRRANLNKLPPENLLDWEEMIADTFGATGFSYQDDWLPNVTYNAEDVVRFNGGIFIAKQQNINKSPETQPTYWTQMVQGQHVVPSIDQPNEEGPVLWMKIV